MRLCFGHEDIAYPATLLNKHIVFRRRRAALVHNSRFRSTIVLYSRIRGSP